SVTGGVEVDGATAASPTTVPGAHNGKGTVTVTVTPETPPATTTPPATAPTTPPPAYVPPTTETEAPAISPEPAVETPPVEPTP
ncbi:MAG TPA: hypothetical protein VH299_03885, partial [Solirubrobacterales bacterium]|nr:hypothetical protein [Solirubrobacterales bacterium]